MPSAGEAVSPQLFVLALVAGVVVLTLLLTDRGVALLRRSFLNSRPEGLIGLDAAAALGRSVQQQAGYTKVQVGPGVMWVKDADLQRLQRQVF